MMRVMKKTVLLLLLVLPLLILTANTAEAAQTVPSGYIAVSTPEQLNAIRNNLSGKYFLTKDIDLTAALSSNGSLYNSTGWQAIGYTSSSKSFFTGVIDGNGHTIKGFKILGSTGAQSFVWTNKGTIKNLTIAGESSAERAHGVFCYDNYGTIQNCCNKVTIKGSVLATGYEYVGGIAAHNRAGGVIKECSSQIGFDACGSQGSAGSASRFLCVGGIAGKNSGTISKCYNTGAIKATAYSYVSVYAGGIAGMSGGNSGSIIENCYNTGAIAASRSASSSFSYNCTAAGILGNGSVSNDMRYCYNAGSITCAGSYNDSEYMGALAGYAGKSKFTSCYYLSGTASSATNSGNWAGTTALTQSQMRTKSTYAGFDFAKVWKIGAGNSGYPMLIINCTHALDYIKAVPATCTTDGNIAYYACDICDKYFNSSAKNQVLSASDIVVKAAHQYTQHEKKEPSCAEIGWDTYEVCSVCGDSTYKELPAAGHAWLVYEAVSPMCEKEGNIAYQQCEKCAVAQMIGNNTTVLEPFEWILNPIGHTYIDGVCTNCMKLQPYYQAGELTGDGKVDNDDVVLLLWHTLFPEDYPLEADADLTRDGKVDNDDVVLLLWHTLFPTDFPL